MHALKLPVGRLDATVTVFGPKEAEQHDLVSWSLKGFQHQGDVSQNGTLADALAKELSAANVAEAYAPNVAAASGNIVNASELRRDEILLGKSLLYRNQFLPADGVTLYADQAFIMSAAGCPLIVATAGNYMIATHAARDSLIDRGAVLRKRIRRHVSVVHAIIERFQRRGASRNEIQMVMLFAIPAKEFEHNLNDQKWGAYNRKLIPYVKSQWPGGIIMDGKDTAYLDLEQVFVGQAHQEGIMQVWAAHSLSEHPELVHTCVGENVNRRNLFIVKRNA